MTRQRSACTNVFNERDVGNPTKHNGLRARMWFSIRSRRRHIMCGALRMERRTDGTVTSGRGKRARGDASCQNQSIRGADLPRRTRSGAAKFDVLDGRRRDTCVWWWRCGAARGAWHCVSTGTIANRNRIALTEHEREIVETRTRARAAARRRRRRRTHRAVTK